MKVAQREVCPRSVRIKRIDTHLSLVKSPSGPQLLEFANMNADGIMKQGQRLPHRSSANGSGCGACVFFGDCGQTATKGKAERPGLSPHQLTRDNRLQLQLKFQMAVCE
jgi:hypothetical protein